MVEVLRLFNQRVRYITLAVVCIGILVGALWYVVTTAPPAVASSVIAASATVLVAVFGTLASKHLERKQEIEKELREQKVKVYQQFIDYQIPVMQRKGSSSAKEKEQDRKFYRTFPRSLISWGSEDVIKKYADWVNWDDPEAAVDTLDLEAILFAMRNDLGYTNKGLKRGDLLRTFLGGVGKRLRAEKTR